MASSKQLVSLVVVFVVAANLAHSAVGIREINNNPAGASDGSDDHHQVAITSSLKNNYPLYDIMMLRGGRLPDDDQRLACFSRGVPCSILIPSLCCSGVCALWFCT